MRSITGLPSSTIKTATLLAAGEAAAGLIPAKVPALTEGVLKAMLMTKLKVGAVVLAMLGMVAVTCGMLAIAKTDARGESVNPAAKADEKPKDAESDKAKTLTVTIKPQKNRVRVKETVEVNLRVVNTSKTTQSIQVMNCSWDDHWKSSNDQVSWVGWDCAKNFAVTVKLEPGEAYEKTLSMFLLAGKLKEKVSFKMGFTPIGSKQTFWSNEATLTVEPAPQVDDNSRGRSHWSYALGFRVAPSFGPQEPVGANGSDP